MAENDPTVPDSSMPGSPQTYSNDTFSVTTDDDPLSVQQVLDADDERPGDESDDDENGDEEKKKTPAPPPPPKKPNGEGEPDQPSLLEKDAKDAKPAKWVRNPDGTFKKNPQHRIQQAVYNQREAERRADAAEARAKEAEARYRQPAPAPPQPQQPAPPPPEQRREGFPSYADYLQTHPDATLEVWLDHRDTYREQQQQARVQAYQQQQEEQAIGQQWQEKLKAVRTADPTFESKLDLTLPMSKPMMDIIKTSPIGPQLMLYLSAHPDETKQMARMPPATVLWAMGNLHGRLSAASSGPAPNGLQPSKATPPIQPVAGSSLAPARNIGADDISFDEHFRSYNAADQKAGRRR